MFFFQNRPQLPGPQGRQGPVRHHRNCLWPQRYIHAYEGHGIVFVDGIPDYVELRRETLPLIKRLAELPCTTLKKYEIPKNYFTNGWSSAVEKHHHRDEALKGSFYFNCCSDDPMKINA